MTELEGSFGKNSSVNAYIPIARCAFYIYYGVTYNAWRANLPNIIIYAVIVVALFFAQRKKEQMQKEREERENNQ
jgi:hypothetical protein